MTTRRWPRQLVLGLGLAAALPTSYRLLARPPRAARPAGLAAGGWRPEFATPGLKGTVGQVLPLADGNMLAVGRFTFADASGRLARNVARWDGANWQALGAGPGFGASSYVFAAAQAPGGDVLVAGRALADNKPAQVMRWNGRTWQRLGTPTETAAVWALAVAPTGEVLAGRGPDGTRVGLYKGGLARWNGQHWQPYATGAAGTELGQWLLTAKGELVAAGYFPQAPGSPKFGVARWTGKAWQLLGASFNNQVVTLAQTANGDLLAGGDFTAAGGQQVAHVARWNGTAWRSMGTGFDGHILRILVGAKGEIVANGEFTKAGSVPARCLARWDGQAWQPLVARDQGYCKALMALMPNGDVLGANNYGGPGPGGYYQDLVRYANQRWLPLAGARQAGFPGDEDITALAASAKGELAVSGYFMLPKSDYWRHGVAYWNGTAWQDLGGIDGRLVTSLLIGPGGELLVGGLFPARERHPELHPGDDGMSKARFVARWDGKAWQPLGAGLPGPVLALAQAPNGNVLASGFFGVARWDGKAWQPLGASPPPLAPGQSAEEAAVLMAAPGLVSTLAVTPKGDIFAASNTPGKRYSAGSGKVLRWDGTAWQPLGPDLNGEIANLAAAPNGDILASGNFSETDAGSRRACSVARWNGQRWQFLGPALPNTSATVAVTAAGTVVIAGVVFKPGGDAGASLLAQWSGTAWQPIGGGLNDYVRQLVPVPGGGFAVAGRFTMTADSTQSLGHLGVYREQ